MKSPCTGLLIMSTMVSLGWGGVGWKRGLRVPRRIWMCWQNQRARCEQNKLVPMSPKRGEEEGRLDKGLGKRNVLFTLTKASSIHWVVCTAISLFTSYIMHITNKSIPQNAQSVHQYRNFWYLGDHIYNFFRHLDAASGLLKCTMCPQIGSALIFYYFWML